MYTSRSPSTGGNDMSKIETVKKAAVWGGPAAAGVLLYAQLAANVTVPVAGLVVGAGVLVSWVGKMLWNKFMG
jgi:hypothetical protein